MTPVAAPAPPRHPAPTPARPAAPLRAPRGVSIVPVAPRATDRLFLPCAIAAARERRGEPATAFHGFCRGHASNPTRALGALPDPDGRLRAGRHRCTCACHLAATRDGSRTESSPSQS